MTPFERGHRGHAFGWCLSLSLVCHVVVIVALALLRRAPSEAVFAAPEVLAFNFGEPIRVRVTASAPVPDDAMEPLVAPVNPPVPLIEPPLVRTPPPRAEIVPVTPTLETAGTDHRPPAPPTVPPPLVATVPPVPTSEALPLSLPDSNAASAASGTTDDTEVETEVTTSTSTSDETRVAPIGSTHHAALVQRPAPEYPRRSVRLREEGTVVIAVTVDAAGAVTDVAVHTSSGHDRLDRAALLAARAARFTPAQRDGVAIGAVVNLPFEFELR